MLEVIKARIQGVKLLISLKVITLFKTCCNCNRENTFAGLAASVRCPANPPNLMAYVTHINVPHQMNYNLVTPFVITTKQSRIAVRGLSSVLVLI